MINFKQILKLLACLILSYQASNSQWQFCGNYTGYIVPFVTTDSTLIAGTYGSGVYYTTNGTNWNYSTNGMTNLKIISLTRSVNNVFAGSEAGGIYRSSDNGVNWTIINEGLTSYEIHTMCSNAGNVYAGTNTGAFMTTNSGNNWTLISTPQVGNIIYALTAYDNKIIAASANGVFITSNDGANWNNITNSIISYIYHLTYFNNAVYAGSSAQGVYKTTNDGFNWIHLNSGLPGGKAVRAIFCESERIYAAIYNSGGIYYLPSGGSSWIPANEGLTQLTCFTVASFNNYIYAGTISGIFRRPKIEFSSVIKIDEIIPKDFYLEQNYPNPFNPTTLIGLSIPKNNSFVKLTVYDFMGKEISTLVNEKLNAGKYNVDFNGENLSSGIYFYTLISDSYKETKRMVLIK
jgi:photosystem II stability/assembly factor-like uncharacterized protein